MKCAIIVVDMLNDFVTGKLTCERALGTIKPNQKLIMAARKKQIPVIFANDAHIKGLDNELKL
jgi:nicotinamidase-related amidase